MRAFPDVTLAEVVLEVVPVSLYTSFEPGVDETGSTIVARCFIVELRTFFKLYVRPCPKFIPSCLLVAFMVHKHRGPSPLAQHFIAATDPSFIRSEIVGSVTPRDSL
jgi:hypothetical protein